jgi:hypothetical protein
MRGRLVHRGIAVLVLTAALGLAGAYPASAQDLSLFERGMSWLVGLWSAPDPGSDVLSVMREAETTDKGLGCDPNGTPTQILPPVSDGETQ